MTKYMVIVRPHTYDVENVYTEEAWKDLDYITTASGLLFLWVEADNALHAEYKAVKGLLCERVNELNRLREKETQWAQILYERNKELERKLSKIKSSWIYKLFFRKVS